MKVILINSPSPFLTNERVFPNIGLVRVGTVLKANGYDVKILDLAGNKDYINEIRKVDDYDYYMFSSTTPQFPYTYKLLEELKRVKPNAKTIIGGPHASALYHLKQKGIEDINIKDLEVFDTIFAGEGEEISNMFKPGWQKGNIVNNIDEFPIPDRDLIDIKSYHYNLFGKDTTCIMTQRGCPYQCIFCCGRDIEMYNRCRMHSPERVLEELDMLNKKYGYTSFMWYDDEINLSITRLKRLCELLSTRNYQHRGFIRSDMIVKYPESVEWLKKAGFVKLCAGVESGSDRVLNTINKAATTSVNSKARQLIRDAGIHYEAFTIIGFPSETIEDIKLTKKWLVDNKPEDFDMNIVTYYPGSKVYDNAIPSKKFEGYDWEYNGVYFNKPRYSQEDSYYRGFVRKSKSNIRTDTLTNEELIKLRDDIDKEIRKDA